MNSDRDHKIEAMDSVMTPGFWISMRRLQKYSLDCSCSRQTTGIGVKDIGFHHLSKLFNNIPQSSYPSSSFS